MNDIVIPVDNAVIYLPKNYNYIPFSDSDTEDCKSFLKLTKETTKKNSDIMIMKLYGSFRKNKNYQIYPKTRMDIYINLKYVDSIIKWIDENFDVEYDRDYSDLKLDSDLPERYRKGPMDLPHIRGSYKLPILSAVVKSFECELINTERMIYVDLEENKTEVHRHNKGKQLHFGIRLEIHRDCRSEEVYGYIYIEDVKTFFGIICNIKNIGVEYE